MMRRRQPSTDLWVIIPGRMNSKFIILELAQHTDVKSSSMAGTQGEKGKVVGSEIREEDYVLVGPCSPS